MQKCGYCRGEGYNEDIYNWSDGPGMVRYTCPLCRGGGEMEDDYGLLQRIVKAEQERAEARAELEKVRTYCGLYVDTLAGKRLHDKPHPTKGPGYVIPDPRGSGYVLAPRPPMDPSYYEEKLQQAGREAPRYEGDYEEHLRQASLAHRERTPGRL
jgi:hypothetical protein